MMSMRLIKKLWKIASGGYDLYNYQEYLYKEKAKKIIINKSRQMGISSFFAFYALLKSLSGKKILVVSPSSRQSDNFLKYSETYLNNMYSFLEKRTVENFIEVYRRDEISFRNGGSLRSIPNSPQTVRGLTVDEIIFDEFAHFQNDKEIWRAVFPMITRGGKVILISTPYGESNLFYEFWTNYDKYDFKRFLLNYRQCPHLTKEKAEELRRSMDELSWRQEYENEFLGKIETYFSVQLLESVEDKELIFWEYPEQIQEKLIFGVDVGRKVDKTAIVGINEKGEVKFVKTMERKTFQEQFNFLKELLPHSIEMRIDSNGIGMQLAEDLGKISNNVIQIQITNEVKLDGFMRVRLLFEKKEVKIPKHSELRRALSLIERKQYGTTITFDAPRTDETGHSDLAFALMLAIYEKRRRFKAEVFDTI